MRTKIFSCNYPLAFVLFFTSVLMSGCELPPPNSITTKNEVVKLEIAPLVKTLPGGAQLTLHARAYFSDGSHQNVSNKARWFSTEPEVLNINEDGTLFTFKEGVSTISASMGKLSIAKDIHVSNAIIEFIKIEADSLTVRPNMGFSLSVFAFFSDGSKLDISKDITWFVVNNDLNSDADVIIRTFDNNFLSLILGEGRITANYNNESINTSTTITVSNAKLNEFRTSISPTTYISGNITPFNAFGYYADGSNLDITSAATWTYSKTKPSESDSACATSTCPEIEFNPMFLPPLQADEYKITVTIEELTESTNITVTEAEIKSIEIATLPENIAIEETNKLQAYAIFENGSTQDISNSVTWLSHDQRIIEVSNIDEHTSNAYALAKGKTEISANLSQILEDTTTITTSDAQLVSLKINSPSQSIALGTSIQLTATGIYADGSSHDITKLASWISLDEQPVLTIGNKNTTAGKVEPSRVGQFEVQAGFKGKTSILTLTISDATLESITINNNFETLYRDEQRTLTATGLFSDSTSQDISHLVTWESSDPTVLFISNHPYTQGLLTAIKSGQTTITATLNDKVQEKQITISDAVISSISIQADKNLVAQIPLQLTATAAYSDDSSRDITEKVYWYTEQDSLSVSNLPGRKGVITAGDFGEFTIYAAFQGFSTSLTLGVELN